MLDLPHLAARVFGTPLLIARGKLDVILGVLAPRLTGAALLPSEKREASETLSITPSGVAIVSVVGTLVARSGYLDSSSGLLAYGAIGDAIEVAMASAGVRGVLLDVDSPGGEVGGLFDLVERITTLKARTGIPLWAVANEDALSAAYAIVSAADRIYVTQTGEVGSIGVVAAHVDESGADTQAGLSWSFIFAGQQKVDGNSHQPLSERARDTIQADVDQLYGDFCTLVSANRKLSIEAVRATQAATYRGHLAIAAGLADRLGTLDLAIAEMASGIGASTLHPAVTLQITRRSHAMANDQTQTIEPDDTNPDVPAAPVVPASPAVPPPPVPTPPIVEPTNPADALRAEYAEIASLAAQAARLGVTIDAADAMRKGVSAHALRRTVLDALATRSEASSVIAAAPTAPGATDSPIIKRARERAAATRA